MLDPPRCIWLKNQPRTFRTDQGIWSNLISILCVCKTSSFQRYLPGEIPWCTLSTSGSALVNLLDPRMRCPGAGASWATELFQPGIGDLTAWMLRKNWKRLGKIRKDWMDMDGSWFSKIFRYWWVKNANLTGWKCDWKWLSSEIASAPKSEWSCQQADWYAERAPNISARTLPNIFPAAPS